jgi:hypothetical protein
VRRLAASIAAGEYPDESPYIPVPLAELDQLVENLPLVCRLGPADQHESLMAWLGVERVPTCSTSASSEDHDERPSANRHPRSRETPRRAPATMISAWEAD